MASHLKLLILLFVFHTLLSASFPVDTGLLFKSPHSTNASEDFLGTKVIVTPGWLTRLEKLHCPWELP